MISCDVEPYKDTFVRNYHKPYIKQPLNGSWFTVKRFLNDEVIRKHIEHDLWAGVRAPYYPEWGIIDFDNPDDKIIEKTIEQLGMVHGEYMLSTSPSFEKDGSTHLLFKPELNGKPPTTLQYRNRLESVLNTRKGNIEVYPNPSIGVRLPFGFKQHILDDGIPLHHLSLSDNLYWFEKIEPFDLGVLKVIEQRNTNHLDNSKYSDFPDPDINSKNDGAILYREGLQDFRTRHNATLSVMIWLFSQNYPPYQAENLTREWIEQKHNGMSRTVNRGLWKEVYQEISNIVEWVYQKLEHWKVYPDSVHNDQYRIYKADIHFIAKIFPGQISKQKKFFKLIRHFRAKNRIDRDWLYISNKFWTRMNAYKAFQNELESMGVLEIKHHYLKWGHSKSFKLNLPLPGAEPLRDNGRNIDEFWPAVKKVYRFRRNIKSALNIDIKTINNNF